MTVCVSPPAPTGFPFKTLFIVTLFALLFGLIIGAGKLSSQSHINSQIAQQENLIEMERKKAETEAYIQQLRLQQEIKRRQAEEQLNFVKNMHELVLDILTLIGLAIVLVIFIGSMAGIVLLVIHISSYRISGESPTSPPVEGYLISFPTSDDAHINRTL